MNHSVSTMSGKTKVKVVFLGNQSVGKSSIIEKYIHDRFDENSNVQHSFILSLPSELIFWLRTYRMVVRTIECSFGIQLANSVSDLSSPVI